MFSKSSNLFCQNSSSSSGSGKSVFLSKHSGSQFIIFFIYYDHVNSHYSKTWVFYFSLSNSSKMYFQKGKGKQVFFWILPSNKKTPEIYSFSFSIKSIESRSDKPGFSCTQSNTGTNISFTISQKVFKGFLESSKYANDPMLECCSCSKGFLKKNKALLLLLKLLSNSKEI